jgi:hypothetical protein
MAQSNHALYLLLQNLRWVFFANAYFGIAHHFFYKQVNALERFFILALPVNIVFPRCVGPD